VRLARRLLLAVWAGLLLAMGAVAAPTLFAVLDDRHLAGRVAGSLFRVTTVISAGIAALLVILAAGAKEPGSPGRPAGAVGPAILLAVSIWLVRPLLEAARAAGAGAAFGAWHAVSSALYWAATAWVAVELVRELRRA
jgi:Domain of unknown function (DUF4149)